MISYLYIFDFSIYWDFLRCICVLLVRFVLLIVILNAFIGFGVFFCIYEDILKCSSFREKYPRSVNNVHTNYLFRDCL